MARAARPSNEEVRSIVIRGMYSPAITVKTAGAIADHYKLDTESVLKALRELKRKRIVRDRRSRGERVWEPWT